jgi:hypothetical protein
MHCQFSHSITHGSVLANSCQKMSLFYVDSQSGKLRELVSKDGQTFSPGALDDQTDLFPTEKGGLTACTMALSLGIINIFAENVFLFDKKDPKHVTQAHWNGSTWSTRVLK